MAVENSYSIKIKTRLTASLLYTMLYSPNLSFIRGVSEAVSDFLIDEYNSLICHVIRRTPEHTMYTTFTVIFFLKYLL